jgi:hypothetical protein
MEIYVPLIPGPTHRKKRRVNEHPGVPREKEEKDG